ncbi:MAG: NADH-quinone oxidoreductase subunit J [Euryarchaeota archaeon]|nr:NADH-quinone oxidoreductase subunit J [Euryarchaeota archaeon]
MVVSILAGLDVERLAFWGFSIAVLLAGVMVVLSRETVRAVVYLAGVFVGVAVLFLFLSSEFLAVVQVLINGGAVTVLILFAVMLTKREVVKA